MRVIVIMLLQPSHPNATTSVWKSAFVVQEDFPLWVTFIQQESSSRKFSGKLLLDVKIYFALWVHVLLITSSFRLLSTCHKQINFCNSALSRYFYWCKQCVICARCRSSQWKKNEEKTKYVVDEDFCRPHKILTDWTIALCLCSLVLVQSCCTE